MNKYGELFIPENLYIIGTVNMDETTFPFSKKVLDRANTIEFSKVDLVSQFSKDEDTDDEEAKSILVDNSFLKANYISLKQCLKTTQHWDIAKKTSEILTKINDKLEKANAHIGYRVRDEIVYYMINNSDNNDLLFPDDAMDNQIMQKILPRIQGSSASIQDLLSELLKICMDKSCSFQTNDKNGNDQTLSLTEDDSEKKIFKCSAEKIECMLRRYKEDGFTTYWI